MVPADDTLEPGLERRQELGHPQEKALHGRSTVSQERGSFRDLRQCKGKERENWKDELEQIAGDAECQGQKSELFPLGNRESDGQQLRCQNCSNSQSCKVSPMGRIRIRSKGIKPESLTEVIKW